MIQKKDIRHFLFVIRYGIMDTQNEVEVILSNLNIFEAIEKIHSHYFRCIIVRGYIYINKNNKILIPELNNLSLGSPTTPIKQMVYNYKIKMRKESNNKIFHNGRR